MNMRKIVAKWSDATIVATVYHYEEIAWQGRLNELTTSERAEFDAAYDEFTDRELR